MSDIEVSNKIIERIKPLLSDSSIVNAKIDLEIGTYPVLEVKFILDDNLVKAMQKDK